MNILFMCVANSARSQMAEGLARQILGPNTTVESAGSHPSKLNPLAVEAMQEIGIDISKHYSKSTDDLAPRFIVGLRYVITLCAEEACPTIASKAEKLHWPFPDPGGMVGSDQEQLERFRTVRDAIQKRLEEFSSQLAER